MNGRISTLAAVVLGLAVAEPVAASVYGVPTNLDLGGTTSAASVDPPGWFAVDGTGNGFAGGEGVHQIRLFIEVTGTTLDVLIFDAGAAGARDISGVGATSTTYTLLSPAGASLATLTVSDEAPLQGGDPGLTTENRLARLTPPCGGGVNSCGFFRPNNPHVNNVAFRGLSRGLYELRIRTLGGTESNAFGVRIAQNRDAAGQPVGSYNVYTTGNSDAGTGAAGVAETAWLVATLDGGIAPPAAVSEPVVMFPYVNRGCGVQTSNFDMDANTASGAGADGTVIDALGAATVLTMSGNATHVENAVSAEETNATNLESVNYGMYTLTNDLGSGQNASDWRVADFTGWSNNPAGAPRNPSNPIRLYLPQGYAPAAGSPNATAPAEPILATSSRVVSGANPPAVGQLTRYLITATVHNPTANPISGIQVTAGIPAPVAFAGNEHCYVDDDVVEDANCTFSNSGAGTPFWRRATLNVALAAGGTFTLNFEVSLTPSLAGLWNLTGAPAPGAPPPNTTVWSQYTPAFSSAAFPRTEVLGPTCNLVVEVGGGRLLTRATLRGLRADPAAGIVEFATGSQRETAAFHLYATDEPGGRGARRRLTSAPVVTAAPNSVAPLTYRVLTGPFEERFLLVEEIDLHGQRRWIGPLAVDDPHLRAAFEAVEARLDEAEAPRVGDTRRLTAAASARLARARPAGLAAAAPAAPAGGVRALKIEVGRAGRVEVPLADLQAAGMPAGVPPGGLRLKRFGRPVPLQVTGAPPQQVLSFQAEALSTDYTGRNVYVLSWGFAPPAPQARLTVSAEPVRAGDTRAERNVIYVPNAPQGTDPWLWDLMIADGSDWPYTYDPTAGDFDLPGLAPGAAGPVAVRVRLVGRTQHMHTVAATINGVAVGRLSFEGAVAAVLTGRVPAEALRAHGNRLSLSYAASPARPDQEALVYVSAVDLALPRAPAAAVAPERVAPYDTRLPPLAVDYLIVTHGLLREQAERLAAIQRGRGLRVAVADVERAYDRFSAGIVEADAIRALIRHVAAAGVLRYVLLLGGDTFDPRDHLGTGAVALVPSLDAWDGAFGRVPSENRYADYDGNGSPNVAIGRLPASTPQEADVMVDKVALGPAALAAAPLRHLFAVDNQGPGDGDFRAEAQATAALLPPGPQALWADVGDGVAAARASLFSALRQGVSAVHYYGHGGPEVWADEGLLTVDDMAALAGAGRPSVFFSWACESGWYQNLFGPALAEALLLVPGGGAHAAVVPAGVTDPIAQRALHGRIYHYWTRLRMPLGMAIRRAKAEALAASPESRPVVEGWNLLGDPALPGLAPPAR